MAAPRPARPAQTPVTEVTLGAVLDALLDGVLVIDREYRVLVQNARAAELLGVPHGQVTAADFLAVGEQARREDGRPFAREDLPVRRCLESGLPRQNVTLGFGRPGGQECSTLR